MKTLQSRFDEMKTDKEYNLRLEEEEAEAKEKRKITERQEAVKAKKEMIKQLQKEIDELW